MKVAIVHDWLVTYAGAERVLAQMLHCFPDADLFSVVDFLTPADREYLGGRSARTTFIQQLPMSRTRYRMYLPLMPLAIEQMDLRGYDLILSSSHAVAKGVITGPDQLHVCYVHSPMRYAWDLRHEYVGAEASGFMIWLKRLLLHRLRLWDQLSAQRPDVLLANSAYIARRISKVWRRPAAVLYPPVDVTGFTPGNVKEDYYLVACRLVPYKRVDIVIRAFAQLPDRRLIVIGDGPEASALHAMATENVEFLGWQDTAGLREGLQRARAFVFAGEEDFGILPVESQACGTPVIAFGRGGLAETVRGLEHEQPTGVLFDEQTPEAVCKAVRSFERHEARITREALVENAARFSEESFRTGLFQRIDASRQTQ